MLPWRPDAVSVGWCTFMCHHVLQPGQYQVLYNTFGIDRCKVFALALFVYMCVCVCNKMIAHPGIFLDPHETNWSIYNLGLGIFYFGTCEFRIQVTIWLFSNFGLPVHRFLNQPEHIYSQGIWNWWIIYIDNYFWQNTQYLKNSLLIRTRLYMGIFCVWVCIMASRKGA